MDKNYDPVITESLHLLDLTPNKSYLSIQVVSSDDVLLFDDVLPSVLQYLSDVYPVALVASCGLNIAEIRICCDNLLTNYHKLIHIKSNIEHRYNNVIIYF